MNYILNKLIWKCLWQRCGSVVACSRVRGTECNSACIGHIEGACHYLHYFQHSLASGQARGKEHSTDHQKKIGLKIYWTWSHPSKQDPVPPSVSLSHQESSISSYPYPSEGRQNENHNHKKLIKLITWTTALSNSMKLWAMSCRATQDGWVMVESSDKTWSTGEGNGKPLQYSCLENPKNSMKKKHQCTRNVYTHPFWNGSNHKTVCSCGLKISLTRSQK